MKATLEFELPEEQYEHSYALAGLDALLAISDLESEIRSFVHHESGFFKLWRNEDGKECQADYETLVKVWDFIIALKQDRRLPELI